MIYDVIFVPAALGYPEKAPVSHGRRLRDPGALRSRAWSVMEEDANFLRICVYCDISEMSTLLWLWIALYFVNLACYMMMHFLMKYVTPSCSHFKTLVIVSTNPSSHTWIRQIDRCLDVKFCFKPAKHAHTWCLDGSISRNFEFDGP